MNFSPSPESGHFQIAFPTKELDRWSVVALDLDLVGHVLQTIGQEPDHTHHGELAMSFNGFTVTFKFIRDEPKLFQLLFAYHPTFGLEHKAELANLVDDWNGTSRSPMLYTSTGVKGRVGVAGADYLMPASGIMPAQFQMFMTYWLHAALKCRDWLNQRLSALGVT